MRDIKGRRIMKKIIGIIFISLMLCNIGYAEIKVIESKTIKDGRFYNQVAGTACVDGYKFVVWGGQSVSMVQFYEHSGVPAKCY